MAVVQLAIWMGRWHAICSVRSRSSSGQAGGAVRGVKVEERNRESHPVPPKPPSDKPDEDEPEDDPDEAPETPLDEPPPAPVKDPPPDSGPRAPYVVRP